MSRPSNDESFDDERDAQRDRLTNFKERVERHRKKYLQKISNVQKDSLESKRPVALAAIDHIIQRVPGLITLSSSVVAYECARVMSVNEQSDERRQEEHKVSPPMEEVTIALQGQGLSFGYLILGSRGNKEHEEETKVYLLVLQDGVNHESLKQSVASRYEHLLGTLRASYPGCVVSKDTTDVFDFLSRMRYFGLMTGVPSSDSPSYSQTLDLIRGLNQEDWFYLVLASPMAESATRHLRTIVMDELYHNYHYVKYTWTLNAPNAQYSYDEVNYYGVFYINLLKRWLKRLGLGTNIGMWQVGCYFGSSDELSFGKMNGLLRGIFAGDDSVPEPLRTLQCKDSEIARSYVASFRLPALGQSPSRNQLSTEIARKDEQASDDPLTLMTSRELSLLVDIPREEISGLNVTRIPRYKIDPPEFKEDDSRAIRLGRIVDLRSPTSNILSIPIENLKRHCLVSGITGSGKTNTILNIILALWNDYQIPFLVIEPTKSEYRALFDEVDGLTIYTLGNEDISPFRINPLEVPKDPLTNIEVPVSKHIDALKSIFNVSFPMWGPLPYVLENMLINTYQKRRASLSSAEGIQEPCLGDLYREVESTVTFLGYSQETTLEISAALKTRIRSLLLGYKGKMLNTRKSTPIEQILKAPTLLELEHIGDDEEKAFLMGILFNAIFEYRGLIGPKSKLQHVTVIEEAHRLLPNISTGMLSRPEYGNPRAKAVETISNMLSELRAYGEGILVVDQAPTKLAPDAIKNTDVKIIHKVVSDDDRQVLAGSTGLNKRQARHLVNLRIGESIVFSEDFDAPYLTTNDLAMSRMKKTPLLDEENSINNQELARRLSRLRHENSINFDAPYIPFEGCGYCGSKCNFWLLLEPVIAQKELPKRIDEFMRDSPVLISSVLDELVRITEEASREAGVVDPSGWAGFCAYVQSINSRQFRAGLKERVLETTVDPLAYKFYQHLMENRS